MTAERRLTGMAAKTDELFGGARVMAILRGLGPERTVQLAHRAWDLGLVCVEVPVQSETDAETLRATAREGAARGMIVGAGTVIDPAQVPHLAELGAGFTVSPGLDPDVVAASHDAGLPSLPGVGSATDVQRAVRLGLTWVKAFPASVLGTGWFRAMHGPFPQVSFVATGGMDAGNAAAYLDAGARMIAVGSALADPDQLPALAELAGVPAR